MDGGNDGRGRVKSVEGRALGAVILLCREQRLQLLAEGLPTRVLVLAATGMGKDGERHRPEAGEAGKGLFFFESGKPLVALDGFERADGGEDVAGLGLFSTRSGRGRGRKAGRPDRRAGQPWLNG